MRGGRVRGIQQIAIKASDFLKKSVDEGAAAFVKLIAVMSLDGAVELQSDLAKSACDHFFAGSTRFGERVAALTKDAYMHFEAFLGQAQGIAR